MRVSALWICEAWDGNTPIMGTFWALKGLGQRWLKVKLIDISWQVLLVANCMEITISKKCSRVRFSLNWWSDFGNLKPLSFIKPNCLEKMDCNIVNALTHAQITISALTRDSWKYFPCIIDAKFNMFRILTGRYFLRSVAVFKSNLRQLKQIWRSIATKNITLPFMKKKRSLNALFTIVLITCFEITVQ